jgi:predicted GNAT family acetyltransferase
MDSNPVTHNEEKGQFEIGTGKDKSFLQYHRTPHSISLIHTEVPEPLRMRGIGTQLIRAALAYASFNQLKVIPICPAVKRYLEKHPEEAAS